MTKQSSHNPESAASAKSAPSLHEHLKKASDVAQARTEEWKMGFMYVWVAKGHAELFNLGVDEAIPVIRETIGGWSAIDFLCDPETEIRAHWDRVHTPLGRGPVEAAIEAADAAPLTLAARSKGYSRFMTVVRNMQLRRGGRSIPLPTKKLAVALGCNRHTIEQYIELAQRNQFLGLFLKAVPRQRAAEFLVDTRRVLAASNAKPATTGGRKSKAENPPPVVAGNSLEKPATSSSGSSVLQVSQVLPDGNLAKNLSSKEEKPKTGPDWQLWNRLYTGWKEILPDLEFQILNNHTIPRGIKDGEVVLKALQPPLYALKLCPHSREMVRTAHAVDPSIVQLSIVWGQA